MNTDDFKQAQKLRDNGKIDESVELYLKVRAEALEIGDIKSAAECMHMIGVAYYQQENYEKARNYLANAQKEFEDQGDAEFVGFVLRDLGLVARVEKKLDEAEKLFSESVEKLHGKNRGHESISKAKLGRVYGDKGEYEKAIQLIKEAISSLSQTKDTFFLSSAYLDWARVLLQKGDESGAREKAQESLKLLKSFAKPDEFQERRKNIDTLLSQLKGKSTS